MYRINIINFIRDNVHRDVSDVPKSDSDINNQVGSKQCHDNNNNNAKSKSQLPLETKKSIQRTTAKISTKRLSDPKVKKQGGKNSILLLILIIPGRTF